MVIDGMPVTVKLDIKKSPSKNKLWVHSIITEKNSIGQDVFSENGIGTSYRTDANGDIITHPDEKVNTLDENILLSDRVTDKETIEFLENQEHIVTYKAMQVIDGKLYPPIISEGTA